MLLAVRIFICFYCFLSSFNLQAKDTFILVVGQSISSNCNQHIFEAFPGVYQIDLNGHQKPAADPFDWADCKQGSMWMPLGKKMVSSGFSSSVTFMPIGVGGTKVSDWMPGGRAYSKLNEAIKIANQRAIKFDYAFWHQGSSDSGQNPFRYARDLSQVLKFISLNLKVDKWIIAQHSKCGGLFDLDIAKTQKMVSMGHHLRRFEGPNTNDLGLEYRFDGCHLNKLGQEKMADLWFESIVNAEKIDPLVQKEVLLYYFRDLLN